MLAPEATMREAVMVLARERGLAMVGADGRVAGVLTAGDLSRLAGQPGDFLATKVGSVMTAAPKTCCGDDLAAVAVGLMERHGIMALPVLTDDGRLEGVVHLHDLMRAGAV